MNLEHRLPLPFHPRLFQQLPQTNLLSDSIQQGATELVAALDAANAAEKREQAAMRESAQGRDEVKRLRTLLNRAELEAQELRAALMVWTP